MESSRTSHPSIYYPEELKMLSRVCRTMRLERGVAATDEGSKEIADLAMALYSAGISDEADLMQKLRQQA